MMTPERESSNTSEQSQDNPSQQKAHGFFYNVCENIDNAVKGATDQASSRATAAVPKVKRVVARGAYGVAFNASYGVVFGALLAKQILKDNVILEGVKEGIKAGRSAADKREADVPASAEPVTHKANSGDDDSFSPGVAPSPA